jgi:hypothetical protein
MITRPVLPLDGSPEDDLETVIDNLVEAGQSFPSELDDWRDEQIRRLVRFREHLKDSVEASQLMACLSAFAAGTDDQAEKAAVRRAIHTLHEVFGKRLPPELR